LGTLTARGVGVAGGRGAGVAVGGTAGAGVGVGGAGVAVGSAGAGVGLGGVVGAGVAVALGTAAGFEAGVVVAAGDGERVASGGDPRPSRLNDARPKKPAPSATSTAASASNRAMKPGPLRVDRGRGATRVRGTGPA
jgi:hypothetical protein